jgi:hypothetical protein
MLMTLSPPITAYLGHPSSFATKSDDISRTEGRIAQAMREHRLLVHTTFDAAADEALMNAPSTEDGEEWVKHLTSLHGTTPDEHGEISPDTRPPHTIYVHKLIFGEIIIATTEDFDTAAHLDFHAKHPDVDALWLPNTHRNPPNSCLRIITSRDLFGRFKLDDSTPIPGRSRPPR